MVEELFRADAYARDCHAVVVAVEGERVELDRTVFYPMGGGQPGDTGTLTLQDGRVLDVIDTRKGDAPERIVHVLREPAPEDTVGRAVAARIDWDRRYRLMRVHTCLHLLCAVIPEDVTGGSIRDDGTGRLDFDIPEPLLDKNHLTEALNRLVEANHAVCPRWITDAELAAQPELVRTMSVKPPGGTGRVRLLDIAGVDLQPCGGTHVAATGEIGSVKVTKIEKKGRQNRRVVVALDQTVRAAP